MNDQNLVLWAIDENMGTNLQAFLHRLSENTKKAITFCKNKTFFFLFIYFFCLIFVLFNSGRARVNWAGRKPVRAGRSALINRPSWNTVPVFKLVYFLSCYVTACTPKAQYCTFYAVCVLYVPVTTQRSDQATLKARPGLKPASLI